MSGNAKILVSALVFGLATWVMAAAQAASQPGSAPVKVGIISIQAAIANTNEGKKDLDALQQRFAPRQTQLKALNDEIDNLKKQLQAQGDKLSDDARAAQVRNIETKQKALQRSYDDAQAEFQQAQQEIVNRVGTKMVKLLQQYAVKNGYGVILDVSNPQTPVLYASENTNITKEIVDAYNAQSPAGAASPRNSGAVARPQPAGSASAATKTGNANSKHP